MLLGICQVSAELERRDRRPRVSHTSSNCIEVGMGYTAQLSSVIRRFLICLFANDF